MGDHLGEQRLRRLIDVGRGLLSQLDPDGRGILGVLIDSPRALRIANVGEHSKSFGLSAGPSADVELPRRACSMRLRPSGAALRRVEHDDVAELLRAGVGQVQREIENLRAIITELRPAALDELGLAPAIEALVVRVSAVEGLSIECAVDLPTEGERLGQELETTVYRLVQEALTSVAKHACAEHARVTVRTAGGRLEVEVTDDGKGFDPVASTSGFGLAGMRERVQLGGGQLTVTPGPSGTTVRAVLPLSELDEAVVEGVSHQIGA